MALVVIEARRALHSPLTWVGALLSIAAAFWVRGEYGIPSTPVMFRVDQVIVVAALPAAAAAGLLVCLAAERDRRAGSWIRSTPISTPIRSIGWLGAALPLVVLATVVVVLLGMWLKAQPDSLGSPRPVALLGAPVMVALFAGVGALVGAVLPVRLGSLAILTAAVGTAFAGRADPAMRVWSPWQGDTGITVGWMADGTPTALHLAAMAATAVSLVMVTLLIQTRQLRPSLVVGTTFAVVLAAGALGFFRYEATSPPSADRVHDVVTGAASTSCEDYGRVQVCTVPGWEDLGPSLATEVKTAMDLLPNGPNETATVVQSGFGDLAGFTVSNDELDEYRVPSPNDERIYVPLHGSDGVVDRRTIAWLVGLQTTPPAGWEPHHRLPGACVVDDDAAAAALWLRTRLEPAAAERVTSSEPELPGMATTHAIAPGVDAGPAASALAAELLEVDDETAAAVIDEQLLALRQGSADLATEASVERPGVEPASDIQAELCP